MVRPLRAAPPDERRSYLACPTGVAAEHDRSRFDGSARHGEQGFKEAGMVSGHLEIETKYDVADSFTLPPLDGLDGVANVEPPVEHELEAVYQDAADLRLLRA